MKRLIMLTMCCLIMMLGQTAGNENNVGVIRALLVAAAYNSNDEAVVQTITRIYWNLRGAGVPADEIIVLDHESRATYPVDGLVCAENIKQAFDAFAKVSTENDTIITHFAGHGQFGTGDSYFYIQDLNQTALRMTGSDFKEQINKVKAKSVLVTLDSCYSGNIAAKLGGGRMIAITPCSGGQTSHYNFSQVFIGALYSHLCAGSTIREAYAAGEALFNMKKEDWNKKNDHMSAVYQSPFIACDEEIKERALFRKP